jgi:Zn-dependent M28 family amino/carboxypeptidase
MNKSNAFCLACIIFVVGCSGISAWAQETDTPSAAVLHEINADSLLKNTSILASNDFEGRSLGGKAEQKTIRFIQKQFAQLGLAPGNPNGSYVQNVPLLSIQSTPALTLTVAGKKSQLHFPDDFVASSSLAQKEVKVVNSELVFVGYGVIAPEYDWDDYKGKDMRGKTLVMLINDPAIPDPDDASALDPNLFKGKEMTYYGRWTYKYEIAKKLGAAAVLIVHETIPAGYPYEVVRHSWANENFFLDTQTGSGFPPVAGWLQLDAAKAMLSASGLDFDALKKAALSRHFKPVDLGVIANIHVKNTIKKRQSHNVLAKIEGSDPSLKKETIIYSAHWDHLGIDATLPGPRSQQIFHGALDNAAGVATLFELAKAYQALPAPPKRTILFIATTAEERGLFGARYYAQHPLYPLEQTLIDINLDIVNNYGRTRDVFIVGSGKSTVDELVRQAAQQQGRIVLPDASPEKGSFFRADQFEFAQVGVPGLYLKSGVQVIGKPASYGKQQVENYIANRYHSVHDVVDSSWDLSGAVEDAQLLFMVGYGLAQGKTYPQWNADAEFHRQSR